ncbi:hypothetical protein K523DRAFT_269649 [Schizophyllum commune Tattone D]|nr:hypothetical protein K525DRAFT_221028 [Schizophyllum commune Loenen D]KAI5831582.1 hypothetical protein K523DRAFT_269649 [Schizophyllum commune Tattone D]
MSNPILSRFALLVQRNGWSRRDDEYWDRRRRFIGDAVNAEFEANFGHDEASLPAWQNICRTVGLKKVEQLTTVAACRRALRPVHVNIIDLVCAPQDGVTCRRFPSREALAQYTRDEEKAYPLEWAKENPLLRQFLVHVYNPPKRQPPHQALPPS